MAEEVNVVEQVVEKKVSKTDIFKQHLQKIIFQELGVKVSKEKAWNAFKAIQYGTVEHVLHLEDKRLSLAGIGAFEILESKSRGQKAGLDKEGNPIEGAEVWPCVPRYKIYPSSVVSAMVEKAYGLGHHDDLEDKHYGIYREDTVEETPVEETPVEGVFEDLEEL